MGIYTRCRREVLGLFQRALQTECKLSVGERGTVRKYVTVPCQLFETRASIYVPRSNFSDGFGVREILPSTSISSFNLLPDARGFASKGSSSLPGRKGLIPEQGLLALNTLSPAPHSRTNAKRVGRGIGSGRGKTSGKGHKGQKARSGRTPRLGFEGGQTTLRRRMPKRGFHNPFSKVYTEVNISKLQQWIQQGRLDASSLITMKDLRDSGCINRKVNITGVKLLGRTDGPLTYPINIQVSRVTESAKQSITQAGGTVTQVYYNKLGLRALLKPEWFAKNGRLLPRTVQRIPIKDQDLYDEVGQLPPVDNRTVLN